MALLDRITTTAELRKLPESELPQVAQEVRERMVDVVSKVGGHFAPDAFATRAHDAGARAQAAVIDDGTPPPAHARFSKPRLLLVVASCVALWSVASVLMVDRDDVDADQARRDLRERGVDGGAVERDG